MQREAESVNVEVSVASEIKRIPPLLDQLIELVALAGGARDERAQVELALLEAMANAVIHGNRMDPRKEVHVTFRYEPGSHVWIVVRDEGSGFDPSEIPEAVDPTGEGGRGIALMKLHMDEVSFQKGGTEVHMWKALTRKSRAALNQTTPAESASGQGREPVIVGAGQERGQTC